MKLIKLYDVHGDPIWVNADQIIYFHAHNIETDPKEYDIKGTYISIGPDSIIIATESPEELENMLVKAMENENEN